VVLPTNWPGKTTPLNLMAGPTIQMMEGPGWYGCGGCPTENKPSFATANAFPSPSLLPSLTTLDNVLLPTVFHKHDEGDAGCQDRAIQLLEEVGLGDMVNAYPRQLSAGQQQRVVVARALIHQPDMIVADEPTNDLDQYTELEIMELFREIHLHKGVTIVIATHNTELTSFGTRAIHMAGGSIVEQFVGLPIVLQHAL
jgi:ABC-type lipoprotein export system ATPase subunit